MSHMKALYDARIEDLGPGDFVRVQCGVCGHDEFLPAMSFSQGLQLRRSGAYAYRRFGTPFSLPRMRCEGEAVVSVRWEISP